MSYLKYFIYTAFSLFANLIYGQYAHDHTLNNHRYFKTIDTANQCRMYNIYYEQQSGSGINGASMDCYLFQEHIKDSLRARFSDRELFEIVQYSKIPFYRIAAFELYSQTDYSKEEVINFLKRGKIPTFLSSYKATDTIPEMYIPIPNSMLPQQASVRFKMLGFLNPGAKRSAQQEVNTSYVTIDVPAYPNTKPLDLENYIAVLCHMRYYCEDRLTSNVEQIRSYKPGQKTPKMPTFYIVHNPLDFGSIDLAYLDSNKTHFELRGAIKVKNNTSKAITVMGQASAHTMCLNSTYVVPPQKEIMIEFKSLVELHHPHIDRSITLRNITTGDAHIFKFKANFINTREAK